MSDDCSSQILTTAEASDPVIKEPQLRAALDGIVLQSLAPFSAGLCFLYIIFAVAHLLFLPPSATAVMTPMPASTASLLSDLHFVPRR